MSAARGRGGGITPQRVVNLLQDEVEKTSQAATARATGLTLKGIQNYLKGIGEPTTATLQKLSNYFEVPVEWLRGEDYVDFWGNVYGDDLPEEQKEELRDEFWRQKAEKNASSPIMVEIFRCIAKVQPEARHAAYAMFRNLCRYIESLPKEELIRQGDELIERLNAQCVCQPEELEKGKP